MKKSLKIFTLVAIIAAIFMLTGCKNDPTKGFKNPKTIQYKTDKGTTKLSYDDDGSYEVVKNNPYVTLKNKDANFRIDIDYSTNSVSQQKTAKEGFAKDKNYKIIDVEFNGYKGYVMIQKQYTTANVYLTLDEENNVISNIKVSPVMTGKAIDELDKGTKPEDVLFNQEKVQQILKTVQYEK